MLKKNKTHLVRQSLLLLIFLSLLEYTGFAQIPVNPDRHVFFLPADSQKLMFHLGDKNFFKNNEYFNPLNEGLTLPGVVIEPSMVYYLGSKTRIEAGASLLKYFGRGGFYLTEPLFRFQYQPAPFFQVVMGSIYGGARHGLIEPLYQWERVFTHPVENGLQFLFTTSRLDADVWLEWKKFIMANDPFQEELLFGTTFSYKLLPPERSFNLSIPLQITVNHHGGQIDTAHVPLRTIANYATGLRTTWQYPRSFVKQLDVDCWFIGYNDLSPTKLQPYKHGFAIYPQTRLLVSDFFLQTGYFYGEGYMNTQGEPLYFSATIPDNGYVYPFRNMITCKLGFSRQIQKGILLATYFELYKDLKISNSDYDYGIHIIFDNDFFITKIK